MNTFQKIVYEIINLRNNPFSYSYDKNDPIKGIHKIFYYSLTNDDMIKFYKNKILFFYNTINNFYLIKKKEEREEFIQYFYKIQKTYHTLNRLCYNYKVRKSKIVVDTDLQLNNININNKNVISIYHNQSRYLFKIEDLLKIIYTSLTNTYLFFSEPIPIKNPYNNIPFGKSILYYIYFQIINNFKILYTKNYHLDIFFKFKECNFNMTKFVNNYEYILREFSIKNYIINSTKIQLKEDINRMINFYNNAIANSRSKIIIDKDFPIEDLIRIMKPYLYLYLSYNYSLIPNFKLECKNKLYKKLYEFQKFNPAFGRKIFVLKYIKINGKLKKHIPHINFNSKHKKFCVYDNNNFMTNHLSYTYREDNFTGITGIPLREDYNIFMQITIGENNQRNQLIHNVSENLSESYESEDDETSEETSEESYHNEDRENNQDYEEFLDSNTLEEEDYYDEQPDEDSIS